MTVFDLPSRSLAAWTAAVSLALLPITSLPLLAHGGAIEVGESAKGPVSLSATQAKAIGLTLVAADFRPLADLLSLNGEIQLLPDHTTAVSTRISGQITVVYAHLGDKVRAGQKLARVQARLVGDPPPSVDISSPTGGVVDAVNVSVGQSVEPTASLFQVSDRSQVTMVARVYEEDLGKVRLGQVAHIRTLSYPDRTFQGKVTLVGPDLDAVSRTATVWFRLANPDGLLKPNLFAKASVVLRRRDAALTIPSAAIIEANGEAFVFVKQGDKYDRVDITTDLADDLYTEVIDGLVPGDEVVTVGNRQVYTMWLTGGKLPPGDRDE